MPTNAVLDLALADGPNPAPLAAAGWQVVCLEVPVLTELGTVVCDVVLFNVGTTEPRVVILRSPEQFDRRGRTQGYQAVFSGRGRRRPRPQVLGQMDLFIELDQAERVTTDDTGQNDSDGSDDVQGGERP